MASVYLNRIRALRRRLKSRELDAIVILDRSNTRYLTGFEGSYSLLVVDQSGARFVTDSRYGEAAAAKIDAAKVEVQPRNDVQKYFENFFARGGYSNLGFEGAIAVDQLDSIKKYVKRTKLLKAGDILSDMRAVKDDEEIKVIRRAVKLADELMNVAYGLLEVGASEMEISQQLRFSSELIGGEGEAFSNIVASGKNSSLPHHHPGTRRLRGGDPVTIDLGVRYKGYCSDLTRTPVLGKPSKKFQEIYEVCLEANEAAIRAIKPGMTGKDADQVARGVIEEAGYGEFFGHGLGHGVGLQIHEAPSLNARQGDVKLKPGNIVTIEPGIYIPGFGGVRIEDYALVTAKGCQVLSKFPKQLHAIPV